MINKKDFIEELLKTEIDIATSGEVCNALYNTFVKSQKKFPFLYRHTELTCLINNKNVFLGKFTRDYENINEQINIYNNNAKKFVKSLDTNLTMNNFIKSYPHSELLCLACGNILVSDNFIVYNEARSGFGIIAEEDFDILTIYDDFVITESKTNCILYAYIDNYGDIETRKLEPKLYDKLYFNTDYPIDKIKEIMESNNSELILFHGIPGGGKTQIIKHLPSLFPNKQFIYMDSKVFSQIGQEGFTNFVFCHEGAVFIFEDCEEILESRDTSNNPFIKGLLNMTDGIFGDHIKGKFICTFNSSLESIDKALLRKGRLSLIYEFKELDKEIVKEIFKEKGIDESLAKTMSLADAWNYDDNNGNEKKQKRIGF